MTIRFFVLAFAITWAAFVPLLLLPLNQYTIVPLLAPLAFLRGAGPALAAFLTAAATGPSAFRQLTERLRPRIRHVPWMAVAVLGPLVLGAATTLGEAAAGMPIGPRAPEQFALFLPLLGQRLLGAFAEEIGWRGFALPRLQESMHPLAASLLLGALWAAWHTPAFFTPGTEQQGESFGFFAIGVLAYSVVFTWIFNRTGSVPVCALLHASINASTDVFERVLPTLWLNGVIDRALLVAWVFVALFLVARTAGRLGFTGPRA